MMRLLMTDRMRGAMNNTAVVCLLFCNSLNLEFYF